MKRDDILGFYNDKILPCLIHKSMAIKKLDPYRSKLVDQASGKTLEVGIGSGANLPHYSDAVTELVGLDHHQPIMEKIDQTNLNLDIPFELKTITAESMPFEDKSFDSVVSTFTLCSIADVNLALLEINRVLKPGAKFYFLEHGKSPSKLTSKIQAMMDIFHPSIAGGCHLSREIFNITEYADFKIESKTTESIEFFPAPYGYFYSGAAVKSD